MCRKIALLLGALLATCLSFAEIREYDENFTAIMDMLNECKIKELALCLKENAIRAIEQVPREFQLCTGVIVKEYGRNMKKLFRRLDETNLPENRDLRGEILDRVLFERITEFIGSHYIEIKIPEEAINQYKRSLEEGRKKKKRKSYMPYLLLFKMKALTLGAIFMKVISVVAFKALVLAKIALVLIGGVALKRFAEYSSRQHPEVYHHSGSYDGHWGRVMKEETPYPKYYDNPHYTTVGGKSH